MTRTWRWIALVSVLALVAAGCGDDDDEGVAANQPATEASARPGGPSLEIVSPRDGTAVKGNVVTLDFNVENLRVVKADGDRSGQTGHIHVFVDRDPVSAGKTIEQAADIIHTTDDPLKVTGLKVGKHTLTAVLGDGTHTRLGDAEDKVTVNVEGPSVDASAPATVAAGQPISVAAAVEGVELVAANGDTSGKTGHLHVFVDKEPAAPGQTIPAGDPAIIHSAAAPVSVPALAPGPHTIWVVVGNGVHAAFDPPVMDKVTVTVQ